MNTRKGKEREETGRKADTARSGRGREGKDHAGWGRKFIY